ETAQDKRDKTETAQDKTEVAQDKTETAQDKRDKTEVAQDKTETAQDKRDKTETAQDKRDKTETAQDKTEVAQDKTETAQDKTEVAQDKTETAQDKTEVAQDSTEADQCILEAHLENTLIDMRALIRTVQLFLGCVAQQRKPLNINDVECGHRDKYLLDLCHKLEALCKNLKDKRMADKLLKATHDLEATIKTINKGRSEDELPGASLKLNEVDQSFSKMEESLSLNRRKRDLLAQEIIFKPMPCDLDILGGRNMVQYALDNASKAKEDLPNINEFPQFFEIPERLKQTNASSKDLQNLLAYLECFSVPEHVGSYAYRTKAIYTNVLITLFGPYLHLHTHDSQKNYHQKVFTLYEATHNINAGLVSAKLMEPPKYTVCYLGGMLQETQKRVSHQISEDDFKSLEGITDYYQKRVTCVKRQYDFYEKSIDYLEEIRNTITPDLSDKLFNSANKHIQPLTIATLALNCVAGTLNYVAGFNKKELLKCRDELIKTKFKDIDFSQPDMVIATIKLRNFYSLRLGIHTNYQLKQGWLLHSNTISSYIENHALNKELDLTGRFAAAYLADAFSCADLDVKALNFERSLELSHRSKEDVTGDNYTNIKHIMADHMPCAKTSKDCMLTATEVLPGERSACMLEDTRIRPGQDIVTLRKTAGLPSTYVKLDEFHGQYKKIYKRIPMIKRLMSQGTKALKRAKKDDMAKSYLNASLSVAMVDSMGFWGTASRTHNAIRYTPLISDDDLEKVIKPFS
ncbi:MAG: hypothetical protein ABW127_09820, partial [Candidatus Thiodiazotropha endolucinida]